MAQLPIGYQVIQPVIFQFVKSPFPEPQLRNKTADPELFFDCIRQLPQYSFALLRAHLLKNGIFSLNMLYPAELKTREKDRFKGSKILVWIVMDHLGQQLQIHWPQLFLKL